MTRLSAELNHRTIDKILQTIMREERLCLGDLHLIRATLPYALVICCYRVL